MQTILFLGFVALSSAQFPQQPYLNIPGVMPPPWQGPIADHINGLPPKDTPEVEAAKQALNQAYAQVLAVLPELPPEERYRENGHTAVHHVSVPVHNVPVVPQHNQHLAGFVPQTPQHYQPQVNPSPKILAEDIPRSPIGEVPEVHAARVAHLKAFQEAAAALPRLGDTYNKMMHNVQQAYHHAQPVVPVPVPQYSHLSGQTYIQDTPEVAKAKAEHAAAVAALG